MTAIGRILQVLGWLWFGAAVAGAIFGFADLEILPGLILVFVARMIRTAAGRRQPDDATSGGEVVAAQPERILNTERQSHGAPPPAVERSTVVEPSAAPKKRNELLESIVQTGQTASVGIPVDEPAEEPLVELPEPTLERRTPKSSAEMIAEARRRWDRK